MIMFAYHCAVDGKPCVIISRAAVSDSSYLPYLNLMRDTNTTIPLYEMYHEKPNSIICLNFTNQEKQLVQLPSTPVDLSVVPVQQVHAAYKVVGENQMKSNKITEFFTSANSPVDNRMTLENYNKQLNKPLPALPDAKKPVGKNVKKRVKVNSVVSYGGTLNAFFPSKI